MKRSESLYLGFSWEKLDEGQKNLHIYIIWDVNAKRNGGLMSEFPW